MRLNHCLESYLRLKPKTAQTALQFYRMRDRAKLPQMAVG